MFKFRASQKVVEIGGVKVGGQSGENPTVLIGTIFYNGHEVLLNEKTGEIDKKESERLIKTQEEFSDKTGNPCMIDVVFTTDEAMEKLLSFVSDTTEMPILIDSPSYKVKISGTRYADEVGLKDRVIYNSLIPDSKPGEFEVIKETGVESAILLAFSKGFMTSLDRVKVIEELLPRAESAGIQNPLIDTFVIDIPSLSMSSKATFEIKNEMGLPCGCGAHNAISTWVGFEKRMGPQAVEPTTSAVNITPILSGADFVLYGPIEVCEYIFPSVSAIDNSLKYMYRRKDQIAL
jgi:tetrahydromethanopterin S-methyltransferase subunit H